MAGSSQGRRCGRMHALKNVVTLAACGSMMASCASDSYQTAAMQASEGGDQKTAIGLAKKRSATSRPDQCSPAISLDCGTLALAFGTLAGYQILDGDRTAGEGSFSSAKGTLNVTDPGTRSSATAMVDRDVSEAFWKVGDRARAVAVFNEVVPRVRTSGCSCPLPPELLISRRLISSRLIGNRRTADLAAVEEARRARVDRGDAGRGADPPATRRRRRARQCAAGSAAYRPVTGAADATGSALSGGLASASFM